MAALVTAVIGQWRSGFGTKYAGPTKVADASETDLSTPDTTIQFDTRGVRRVGFQVVFANYTSVTVKFQRSYDEGTTWDDVGTSVTTTGDTQDFAPEAPLVRLSIAGTLSAGADTLTVWVYMERQPV